uniref:Peptidase C19 ubiquitin carboxyl-terminal hydrolase domain-containing protein n=1 Tax=Nothobranchius furzeri TaxID=105023 RepID=A0A8C6M4Z6_NOTFU
MSGAEEKTVFVNLTRRQAAGSGADDCNIPLQLKKVLTATQSDATQHAPHRDFLHCLDRNSIRLNIQHDADEIFLSILGLIRQKMDDRVLALEIENLYKISVETQLQCLECDLVQTRSIFLLSLPLHIKEDENSLEGGVMTSVFLSSVLNHRTMDSSSLRPRLDRGSAPWREAR